ncbi:transcriptional regulator [Oceanobacillus picturae]|uniref:Transcriptional regulator n=1 Tax=Oceanobacillus picturae TaxID=171693 RepID=A0A0U9H5R8_9BACI|nr:helix-turn-helix transcriptional regulator [Oceanobacillus picturae]GAQ17987.1 transcriptional regulator [Oceanobacillus picturae]
MDLVRSLRFMRKRSGYSQEEFAPKMFMSRPNISKIERGQIPLRAQDLIRWAKETNSQDVLVALACNIDITMAADLIANITDTVNVAGSIILSLGGLI